jgi:hypothetical protein
MVVKTNSTDESRITEFKCSEAPCGGIGMQTTELTIGTVQLRMVGDHTHQHVDWSNVIPSLDDNPLKKQKPGLPPPVKAYLSKILEHNLLIEQKMLEPQQLV